MMNISSKITLSALLCIFIIATGCTKGGDLLSPESVNYIVDGKADALQVVPSNTISSSGTFIGQYDELTNNLTGTLSWTALWTVAAVDVITGVKFYGPASAGANGPLLHSINFTSNNLTGSLVISLSGNIGLLENEKQDFLSGRIYYVITTQKYPNGIIRGQLLTTQK